MPGDKRPEGELCPECGGYLLEIMKDDYPEYINHGNVEGFRHRYVCKNCGHEIIYNTVMDDWSPVPEDTPFHYGKKGNRLLYKVRKQYLDWFKENWKEIQQEYIEYCRWAGHVDRKELKKMDEWVTSLGRDDIILHLRQISDEISNPDYSGCANVVLALEIFLLAERLEDLTG
ncbi:MAG: hypothetical protein ACLFVP_09030 [Candidatus Bathyarchaeia archaeon]